MVNCFRYPHKYRISILPPEPLSLRILHNSKTISPMPPHQLNCLKKAGYIVALLFMCVPKSNSTVWMWLQEWIFFYFEAQFKIQQVPFTICFFAKNQWISVMWLLIRVTSSRDISSLLEYLHIKRKLQTTLNYCRIVFCLDYFLCIYLHSHLTTIWYLIEKAYPMLLLSKVFFMLKEYFPRLIIYHVLA